MNGAAYAAWNDNARFNRMNGYGSQWFVHAITLSTIQAARMTDCTMIKLHEPIVAATTSATRWPTVRCALYSACQFFRLLLAMTCFPAFSTSRTRPLVRLLVG